MAPQPGHVQPQNTSICDLPPELLNVICSHLPRITNMADLRLSCKYIYRSTSLEYSRRALRHLVR
ncbi:hypothetical protein BDW59DRAFT_153971 [Aspergillus cavernicola]|uniref:F-box domain-containing protein n=1 Tax=Aspergillus cavernicola TaxID=176166 RepID=A0ABR4HKF6_9EURO